jgi:hypothetical protein
MGDGLTGRRRIAAWASAVGAVVLLGGCSEPGGNTMKELQHAMVGPLDVVLLSPSAALSQGQSFAILEFRRADATLVDVGSVRVSATMPMAGAPTMIGGSEVKPTPAPGRYEIVTDFSMAGTWRLAVEWDGPAGKGATILIGTVR